jgi:hypothetical protein
VPEELVSVPEPLVLLRVRWGTIQLVAEQVEPEVILPALPRKEVMVMLLVLVVEVVETMVVQVVQEAVSWYEELR